MAAHLLPALTPPRHWGSAVKAGWPRACRMGSLARRAPSHCAQQETSKPELRPFIGLQGRWISPPWENTESILEAGGGSPRRGAGDRGEQGEKQGEGEPHTDTTTSSPSSWPQRCHPHQQGQGRRQRASSASQEVQLS